ncbi:MAG: hypothetical protein H6729_17860, partial [Deltaproteobacteria bacterium]|nr:hypothetical protein [Deltaproteobacteria bacterium]
MSTILIVDRDLGFAESAQRAFEAAGHKAIVLDDAQMSDLRQIRPSVLIVSVELGDSSFRGFSLCSRIRRDKELSGLPIILTSAEPREEALRKHAESPDRADDYATKPIELPDLVARTRQLAGPDQGSSDDHGNNGRGDPHKGSHRRSSYDPDRHTDDADEATLEGERPGGAFRDDEFLSASDQDQETGLDEFSALRGQAELSVKVPALRLSSSGGAPDQEEEVARPESGQVWPADAFEAAIRQESGDEPPPPSMRKPTPEERVAYLRELVNYHTAKDVAIQKVWRSVQNRGAEIERIVIALHDERSALRQQVASLTAGQSQAIQEREEIEQNFREFDRQIRGIFAEKDHEQSGIIEERDQVQAELASVRMELSTAQARHLDDERRISIIQEELEALSLTKEELQQTLAEYKFLRETAEADLSEVRARLGMTEAVADERADEISQLRDSLDSLALEGGAKIRELEDAHKDALAKTYAQHADAMASMQSELEANIEALEASHVFELQEARQHSDKAILELETSLEDLQTRLEDERRNFEDRQTTERAALEHEHLVQLRASEHNRARAEGATAEATE